MRLTLTQRRLLDYLVDNGGRGLISAGARSLRVGVDRETRDPLAQCNSVTIHFLQAYGWIIPVPSNVPGRYGITMQGRIVRCKDRWRRRRAIAAEDMAQKRKRPWDT